MKKKHVKWTLLALLIFIGAIAFLNKTIRVSQTTLEHRWQINGLFINEEDVTKQFESTISFLPNGLVYLPRRKGFDSSNYSSIFPSKWQFKRLKLLSGSVFVFDEHQDLFSGQYLVQIVSSREPWSVRIYNDSISFNLVRRRNFFIPAGVNN